MAFDESTENHGAERADLLAQTESLYDEARAQVIASRELPASTYRVQFNRTFGFRDAEALVAYWERLGISHLYASPYLKAVPGSTHGYDCVDHNQLNPEVGTEVEHHSMCQALTTRGLGQILDVVPNHMGIERENPLWWDVLENGPASLYAQYFDVDWNPVMEALRGKVLLPVLGDQYGRVLERGELKLHFEEGAFSVRYYDHAFPVAPRNYRKILRLNLEELQKELGPEDMRTVELLSVLTAIEHLPDRMETERQRRVERNREKEVIKRRLATLCSSSP
ncbi:MAG TPA: alpha-amylase family glycosyl hydrolase, partial [Myxococcaceae bacterium]|nr:alpha-amylase family glycosyl hydrolase [Myxococcaceae bacterium]